MVWSAVVPSGAKTNSVLGNQADQAGIEELQRLLYDQKSLEAPEGKFGIRIYCRGSWQFSPNRSHVRGLRGS